MPTILSVWYNMPMRYAYGYGDDEYLKLRIFNLHRSTYALTG
jgi:hypothetical protein